MVFVSRGEGNIIQNRTSLFEATCCGQQIECVSMIDRQVRLLVVIQLSVPIFHGSIQ